MLIMAKSNTIAQPGGKPDMEATTASKQKKEEAVECACGKAPCTVKYRSKYMITCPDAMTCAMRSRWKSNEQDAIKDWNNTVKAARHQKMGG